MWLRGNTIVLTRLNRLTNVPSSTCYMNLAVVVDKVVEIKTQTVEKNVKIIVKIGHFYYRNFVFIHQVLLLSQA